MRQIAFLSLFNLFCIFQACIPVRSASDTSEPEPFVYWQKAENYKFPKSRKPASSPDTIYLDNPSFEGLPGFSRVPNGWKDYGADGETPVDTQPGSSGVKAHPYDGDTYISMVTRDNGTNEICGQELDIPLQKGEKYRFELYLAKADTMYSVSRQSGNSIYIYKDIRCKILGYTKATDTYRILDVTDLITHTNWKKYSFSLEPKEQVDIIFIQASVKDDVPIYGNILVDHCSPIVRVQE